MSTNTDTIGCKGPCAACRIDRVPISQPRDFDKMGDRQTIRRPVLNCNPGRVRFTVPDDNFSIVTAKPFHPP